jgi:hypothetical protein
MSYNPDFEEEDPKELRSTAINAAIIFIILFCCAVGAGIYLFISIKQFIEP